jgi:hypothetical protein
MNDKKGSFDGATVVSSEVALQRFTESDRVLYYQIYLSLYRLFD